MDIDKLTHAAIKHKLTASFSTLLDIDKLTQVKNVSALLIVLVLCWILINLHDAAGGVISDWSFSTLLDIDKLTHDIKSHPC